MKALLEVDAEVPIKIKINDRTLAIGEAAFIQQNKIDVTDFIKQSDNHFCVHLNEQGPQHGFTFLLTVFQVENWNGVKN